MFQFFFGKKKLIKKVEKLNNDIKNVDEIYLRDPIWGGKPAPAIQILLENLDMR